MTFYGVKDSLGRNLEKHLLFSWQPKLGQKMWCSITHVRVLRTGLFTEIK